MPIILQSQAAAGTIANRKLTIGSSVANANTSYNFNFDLSSTFSGNVGSVDITFCTTALGTCTTPTGIQTSGAVLGTQTINAVAAGFTVAGTTTGNVIQITRTPAAAAANNPVVLNFTGIVNPNLVGNSTSYYGRITVFSDAAYTTAVDSGNVAAAIVRQITVNGRVAERLDFCVGAVTDGDAGAADTTEDASITGLNDNAICTGTFPSTSTVDIGVLDDTAVYFSPVNTTPTNGSLDNYGLAAVKTNASNGVNVSFYVEDATAVTASDGDHLKAFRVVPTDCQAVQTSGLGLTDQCFKSSVATGEAIVAGTEQFGMKVSCFYQNATFSTTTGLTADANYADAATARVADCENDIDNANYAWNETGIADTISSSTGVVDDELIKFAFGATTSSTTPTGNYTVVSTYIATPTF
ncbi:MAG: hypothetical protein ACR2FM_05240 [Candidatus Saccharimonadales bacterium]